ncbi:hypothetical protein [Legionella shakespearei]|uniref:DNA-binding domain-containing protein n=1 Tax=Legionella shakespearei DSM 23087 TaxID=1122169 RepID=A0A0W0YQY8_9GAMM|nr:hypothetical protein [Legionella shakespearei]KTD59285.1 hypothetical protein Lsha_1981 [Legionella shakespearei DSM 23087]
MDNNTIQTVLAALITNLNALENYDDFRTQISSDLNLTAHDMQIIDDFYQRNSKRFIASARILKKNRGDDIKASLPITVDFLDTQRLTSIWDSYLDSLTIKANPPKNPLAESICFAFFAEQSPLLDCIEKQIVRYERIRNEVTYKHHENFIFHASKVIDLTEFTGLDSYIVYIHECYRIEEFEYNIPSILNKKDKKFIKEDCTVLFFKNLKKEGIGTLSLSKDVREIVEKVIDCQNLLAAYHFFEERLSQGDFLGFLKKLEQLGVWVIQQREG